MVIDELQMPNVNTKAHVLVRDGFTCRYCGTRLYLAQAVKILDQHIPEESIGMLTGNQNR